MIIFAVGAVALMRRMASKPEMSGRFRSSRMMSGVVFSICRRAIAAVPNSWLRCMFLCSASAEAMPFR